MGGLLKSLVVKLVKGHWGRIIPAVFKSAGEGDFGPQLKAVYWFGEKYATVTGAIFMFVGTGLEAVASGNPEYTWAPTAAQIVFNVGGVLSAAGLLRGATNSPWPDKARADVKKELKAEDVRDANELKEKK